MQEKIIQTRDIRAFYKYIRNFLASKSNNINIINTSIGIIQEHKEIAHEFNKYFSNIFIKNDIESLSINTYNNNFPPITISELTRAVRETKPRTSTGPDKLPIALVLKICKDLPNIVLHMFNLFLKYSFVPDIWNKSIICPLYKGTGCKTEIENYRPISLTCILCRIFERIIKNRLIIFLNNNNIISKINMDS